MNYLSHYKELVTFFGNQHKTANALGCKQPSVWKWIHGKSFMSVSFALKAEKLTKGEIKAVDLCPALAELEETL